MGRWVIRGLVTLWAIMALGAFATAVGFAHDVSHREERLRAEVVRLHHEQAVLEARHLSLQLWVAQVLRPWIAERLEEQREAITTGVPPPDVGAPPEPPVSESPEPPDSPTPAPSPSPTGLPTPPVVPSPSCLPLVCGVTVKIGTVLERG